INALLLLAMEGKGIRIIFKKKPWNAFLDQQNQSFVINALLLLAMEGKGIRIIFKKKPWNAFLDQQNQS
ncbi:hypothetical protein QZK94_26055, partial [Escherichia coli]|uniref:hypothetical protein n=1 Tax=Escherichia coli TaxID=562 RepID=UPI0026513CC1